MSVPSRERQLVDNVWKYRTVDEGGGSQAGAVRLLDLGVVTCLDLAAGLVTLYTPAAGEVVGPVILADLVHCDNSMAVVIDRDESVYNGSFSPPFKPGLAAWDSDLARDGYGWTASVADKIAVVTAGPVTVGLTSGLITDRPADAWQANHAYTNPGVGLTSTVVAAGHLWSAGDAGTSGGSTPDFAGNFGGSVLDNDIEWSDYGEIAGGAAQVYAYASVPDTPA